MLLYIVRHGNADSDARSDDERVLTAKGIRVTTAMASLLAQSKFEPPELILTSPLPRAEQTAKIMQEVFAQQAQFEIAKGLVSGTSLEAAMSVIASKKGEVETLMIVGHDPVLSRLTSAIVSGSDAPAIEMKKSAVAIFELTRFEVPRMRGILRAFVGPEFVS
jgi:phosphohistidine phosphatase